MSICIGKNATDASKRTVTIKTPQAEVEVNGFRHDQPGVCPYCHKKIPLRTVIFKKVDTNGNTGTFTSAVYAIIIAVFYQVVMIGLYIYGYHVLPGDATQVGISIVNQDGTQGETIQEGLASQFTMFKTVITNQNLDECKEALNDRTTQMIIVIPPDFVNNLAQGNSEFDFYINESNPITTISAMRCNFNSCFSIRSNYGEVFTLHQYPEITAFVFAAGVYAICLFSTCFNFSAVVRNVWNLF